MNNLKIGIIGGSGMEDTQLIDSSKSKNITTSFGDPSSQLITGHIQNVPINFISRHGLTIQLVLQMPLVLYFLFER